MRSGVDDSGSMILCVGTTPTVQQTMTFSRITVDAVNRASRTIRAASGKSINVARVARTLGADVLASGFLGGDTGAFIRKDLDTADIRHDFVEITQPTRTCVTVINQADGSATELVEESVGVDPDAYEQLLARIAGHLSRASVLVLSGALPQGAPDDFYGRCVAAARKASVPSIVDGRGPALLAALPQHPTWAKPNAEELALTLGVTIDDQAGLIDAARRLQGLGAENVLITRGPEAALLLDREGLAWVHPPRIRAVSPIGSGDAVAAGLAVGISRGWTVERSVCLGMAAGAANALRPVAGLVDTHEVERLTEQVRWERPGQAAC